MRVALLACALGLGVLACAGDPAEIDVPELTPRRDAAVLAPPIPDGAVLCEDDDECDDGVACTRDRCLSDGYCGHAVDNVSCGDGVFCNGEEICDPEAGCRAGRPRTCDDANVCTIDRCDEVAKGCAHEARDFDDDGEVDWHCFSGTDCDDFDATRGVSRSEICRDGIDNDCDGTVDEAADCGMPAHDRCDDALDVSAGGVFSVAMGGTVPDYALNCGGLGEADVAFSFTTDKPQDVTLVARGRLSDGSEEVAVLAVRRDCEDWLTEIECAQSFPAEVRMRALPAGRYFVIAGSPRARELVLDVRFAEPTEGPTNQSCASPLDVSAGGRFVGDFVDATDTEEVECRSEGTSDLVYYFTTESELDVEVSTFNEAGEPMYFSVRTTCEDAGSSLRCVGPPVSPFQSFGPARGRLHQLPAGTYFLVVEGPASREVDFVLDIAFLAPTPPPVGDGCGAPEELSLDASLVGSLSNRQDRVNVQCGCAPDQELSECSLFLPDNVYRFELEEASDIRIEVESERANIAYDLRATCDAPQTQISCRPTGAVHERIRNLAAGEYFLVIESPEPADYMLTTETLEATFPVEVADNGQCATAQPIPPEGGLFIGDTLTGFNDHTATCGNGAPGNDVAFRLVLSERSDVTAEVEAAFDTVLYRFTDTGAGPEVCQPRAEDACNDDIVVAMNTNSRLEERLAAGVYYYIVDGFDQEQRGRYTLEVTIDPL